MSGESNGILNGTPTFEKLREAKKHIQSQMFHIKCIENEDDKDNIETHIRAIEISEKFLNGRFDNVRHEISVGFGDFRTIKDKCISFGLV